MKNERMGDGCMVRRACSCRRGHAAGEVAAMSGPPACAGSPCARCPREGPGKACMTFVPETGQRVSGCGKWYSWYTAAWQSIRRQGLEAIGKKAEQDIEKGGQSEHETSE